jgi:hypothetical protein
MSKQLAVVRQWKKSTLDCCALSSGDWFRWLLHGRWGLYAKVALEHENQQRSKVCFRASTDIIFKSYLILSICK